MKFALKSLVAAAAFVAVGAASAAAPTDYTWSVEGGTGGLTFSADALSALSASSSSVITAATIPTTVPGLPNGGATNTAVYTKATGNVALTFSDASITGATLDSLQAANSLVQIRRTTVNDDDTTTSRSIYLSNFDVNLSNSTISADVFSRTNSETLVSYGKLVVFKADQPGVSGGTGGNIVIDTETATGATGHASGSLNGSLRFDAGTADIVLNGLGLSTSATDPVAILVRTANWGTTQASGTFTGVPAVPEPSTYALLGAGLLAMGAVARRRKSA